MNNNFCQYCGARTSDNWEHCQSCGGPVPEIIPMPVQEEQHFYPQVYQPPAPVVESVEETFPKPKKAKSKLLKVIAVVVVLIVSVLVILLSA